jgi:hypothetical protein
MLEMGGACGMDGREGNFIYVGNFNKGRNLEDLGVGRKKILK